MLAAIGATVASGYLKSPERQSRLAVAEAAELDEDGKAAEAIELYEKALRDWDWRGDPDALDEAATALVRLYAADVPDPLTQSDVEKAARLVARFKALPATGSGNDGTRAVMSMIEAWADEIGSETPDAARASIHLLGLADKLTAGDADKRLAARRRSIEVILADGLAAD